MDVFFGGQRLDQNGSFGKVLFFVPPAFLKWMFSCFSYNPRVAQAFFRGGVGIFWGPLDLHWYKYQNASSPFYP